jgi:16S rRNA (uracil1498-N3)-methyltransferase
VIERISASTVKAIISNITRLENEPFHNITLAMGICRPAKMDEIVEKGVEIGVSSFMIFYSDKSYVKLTEEKTAAKRISRLKRITLAAVKQSKRSLIPKFHEPLTFTELIKKVGGFDLSLIAEKHQTSKSLAEYKFISSEFKDVLLVVGPESGLSGEEVDLAVKMGIKPVSLGQRRLRAETAGMIFPALVLNHLGDL